jgi:hypothetical protein
MLFFCERIRDDKMSGPNSTNQNAGAKLMSIGTFLTKYMSIPAMILGGIYFFIMDANAMYKWVKHPLSIEELLEKAFDTGSVSSNEFKKTKAEIKALDDKNSVLDNESERLKRKNERLISEVNRLKDSVSEKNGQMSDKNVALGDMGDRYRHAESEASRLEKESRQIEGLLAEKNTQLQTGLARYETEVAEHHKTKSELDKLRSELVQTTNQKDYYQSELAIALKRLALPEGHTISKNGEVLDSNGEKVCKPVLMQPALKSGSSTLLPQYRSECWMSNGEWLPSNVGPVFH